MSSQLNGQLDDSVRQWRRYPSYSTPGSQWIDQLPSHWQLKRLKHVASIQTGLTLGKDYAERQTVTRPYLRVANVQDGYLDLDKITEVSVPVDDVGRHELRPGDVLMTEGGDFDKLGRGYVWEGQINGCLHQNHIFAVRPKGTVLNPRFLASLMTSAHGKNYFTATSQQTTNLASTNSTKLKHFPLPLPTVEEQQAILAFLDRETAKIDALIAKKERLIDLLQEKRTALISHAVARGVDTSLPLKESRMAGVSNLPQSWAVLRNKILLREIDERSTTGSEELLTVSHITGVTARADKPDVTMFLAESLEGYKRCEPGDFVINTMWAFMGAVGIAHQPGVVSPSYNVYRLRKPGVLEAEYIDLLYRTPAYKCEMFRHSQGVWHSRLRLYPDAFFDMLTLVPPIAEQRRIVQHVAAVVESEDRKLGLLRASIDKLREYRTALISAAVTGIIDVREEGRT